MSRSKAKGTAAETAVVNALQRLGWPHVERRALTGNLDKGDIAGMPGVCWEVKDAKTWQGSGWLQETLIERVNANADHGILVIKLPRIGHNRAEKWLTVMDDTHADNLMLLARYPHGLAPLPRRTIKAMGLAAGVAELQDLEKSVGSSLCYVRVKRRSSVLLSPGTPTAYYDLMRLDARCKLLTYAGYGGHEIMVEAT